MSMLSQERFIAVWQAEAVRLHCMIEMSDEEMRVIMMGVLLVGVPLQAR